MTILDSQNKIGSSRAVDTAPQIYKEPKDSAYRNTSVKIFLAVLLQIVILTSFAAKRAYTINTGTVVTLPAHTFDPCDAFRGDYVNLQYDALSIPSTNISSLKDGEECYTVLKKHYPYWKLIGTYKEKPELADTEVMLKGKVSYNGRVQYGIEQFFVPEGNGKVLEKSRNLKVEVAIDNTGCAMVKSVVPE